MSDRTVTARLRADVSGYVAGMTTAAAATKKALGSHLDGVGQTKAAYGQLGTVAGATTLGIAAGVAVAIGKFAQFDQQMSYVASTSEDARANMVGLRDAAIDAGASTVYSATEAGGAIENLAKAGLSAAEILGGALAGSLDLAAAGSFAVGEAASITAGALTQYGLAGDQAVHVSDLLAAGATKAQGDVRDLGLALQYVGTPLAALDVSIEQTTGTLALLADNMIIGERAGTSLRSVIASLTAPSVIAREKMAELGISVFDAQGKFIGLDGAAGELNRVLGDATDAERSLALGVIFGNEALQAANVLTDAGAEGVRKWTAEVNDGTTAAEIAGFRLDNLAGDFERLQGAIDSALIKTGAGGNDVLRNLTQTATAFVDVIGGLPPGLLAAGLGTAALMVAAGLLGTAYFLAAPKVLAFRTAVQTTTIVNGLATTSTTMLGRAVMGLGLALGVIGAVVALATVAVGLYAKSQADARQRVEDFSGTLDSQTGALTANTQAWAKNIVIESGAAEAGRALGITSDMLARAYLGNAAALDVVEAALERARSGQTKFAGGSMSAANAVGAVQDALNQGAGVLDDYAEANDTAGAAARSHYITTALLRGGLEGVGSEFVNVAAEAEEAGAAEAAAAEEAKAALDLQVAAVQSLIGEYETLNGTTMSAAEAAAAYQQSLDDLAGVQARIIEEFGSLDEALNDTRTGFDLNTQAGRDLQAATFDVAKTQVDAAQTALDLAQATGGDMVQASKDFVASQTATRDALVATLIDMGFEDAAARTLADSIVNIPDLSETELLIEDAEAKAQVEAQEARLLALAIARETKLNADPSGAIEGTRIAQEAVDSLHGKTVHSYHYTHHIDLGEGGGGGVAEGGRIGGYSPSDTADNIPAMLTAGEAVIPVRSVRMADAMYGRGFIDRLIAGGLATGRGAQSAGYAPGSRIVIAPVMAAAGGRVETNGAGASKVADSITIVGTPAETAADALARWHRQRVGRSAYAGSG